VIKRARLKRDVLDRDRVAQRLYSSGMGYQNILVAAQLSAITSPAQTEEVVVSSSYRGPPSLGPVPTDSPADHAVYASVFHTDRTGTILLRVIDGGLTIELVSLGADLPPVRFVFPALLLPNPGIFDYGSDEVHVIGVTERGDMYRLVIPVTRDGGPWRQPFAKTWTREYTIKNTRGTQFSGLA
jgi:nuclear pore complex protein Nup160